MKQLTKAVTFPVLIILLTVIISNCHSSKELAISKSSVRKGRIENFDKFYVKFHTDSAFQVSRTKFPLGGMSVTGSRQVKWTRENLPVMKTMVYDIDTITYQVSVKKTDNTFIQKVWVENSGFSSECRFEVIGNKWYLVYVLDENL